LAEAKVGSGGVVKMAVLSAKVLRIVVSDCGTSAVCMWRLLDTDQGAIGEVFIILDLVVRVTFMKYGETPSSIRGQDHGRNFHTISSVPK
jgi:hypothetical protein